MVKQVQQKRSPKAGLKVIDDGKRIVTNPSLKSYGMVGVISGWADWDHHLVCLYLTNGRERWFHVKNIGLVDKGLRYEEEKG
jgi:hypothetical protein